MIGNTKGAEQMAHLLERDDALELLASELSRASGGRGRLVRLRGASGTGRSALLEAAIGRADSSGFRVLSARCSREDSTSPLSSAFRLMGAAGTFQEKDGSAEEREDGPRLWQALQATSAEFPLLLAVDDAHFADPASRSWLIETARRIDCLPILLVVTERSQYDILPPVPDLSRALSASSAIAHTLAPLSEAASAGLVRTVTPSATTEWIAECVRACAGNPLLLHALLEDVGNCSSSHLPETSAALYPGAYPAAVDWWLSSAGEDTTQVARALAVADQDGLREPYSELVRLLTEACGTDSARTLGWLTAMTRLGMLREGADGSLRYAHPLLRDAVLGDWPTERREAVSRSFAEVMLRRGDHAEAVARQLMRSGPVGRGWALRALEDAASIATHADRPLEAIQYLRRGLEESDSDASRQRLLNELGSMEYTYGNSSAGVQRLHEALIVAAGPNDRARTAIALGTALTGRGEIRDAVCLLRETERELGGHPMAARSVQAATVLLTDREQGLRSAEYRRLLDGTAHGVEALGAAGRALLIRHAAIAGEVSSRRAMTQVRGLLSEPADELSEPFLLGAAATVALWADALEEAESLAERGLAERHWTRLHPVAQMLLEVRAEIAALRGDYKMLLAEHVATTTNRRPGPAGMDSYALHALTEMGRFEEARRLMQGVDLSEATDSWELSRFLYACGTLRAARGDVAGALHDFLDCGRRLSAHAVISPVVVPWRTAAAACRLAMGDRSAALALAHEELRLARIWNTSRAVGRALHAVAAATGGQDALALGAEAVRMLRQSPDAGELVSALLSHGRQLASSGQRAHAREHYQEAAQQAERLGSTRLRTAVERDLRTVGARRPYASFTGSEALTGSERRVAELAAEGRTNTEISSFLRVTRRTVESHLTSTYRKLGIHGRDGLEAALAAGKELPIEVVEQPG
ncbi:AAA family ATPase [Streptomyces scopuliridis]|uniref:AAA family ATPase n=1 Tax=Streptomyces scopuliridis TaxID=452529 RepID=UPI001FD44803|nr:AAA family ATPase [Streptomyces scopuliridis]